MALLLVPLFLVLVKTFEGGTPLGVSAEGHFAAPDSLVETLSDGGTPLGVSAEGHFAAPDSLVETLFYGGTPLGVSAEGRFAAPDSPPAVFVFGRSLIDPGNSKVDCPEYPDPGFASRDRKRTIYAVGSLLSSTWERQKVLVRKRDQIFLRPCAFRLSQADQPHQQRILASWKITLSLAAKLCGSSLSLCRKLFFSPHMSDEEVRRYQQLLKASSRYPMLDLRKLKDSLPLPRPRPGAPPVFVLAAENDFVVDREGSEETAEWFGTQPVIIEGSGHDVMLDTAWETGAKGLKLWLDQQAM